MVRAILDGRKTQTRRVLNPQPDDLVEGKIPRQWLIGIGDRLWVRENISIMPRTAYHLPKTVSPDDPDMAAYYQADFYRSGKPRWRPSIHMPRWASRINLTVTDVRVQRLQEISEADAAAEGLEYDIDGDIDGHGRHVVIESWRGAAYLPWLRDPMEAYADLWDHINAARGYGWDADPWVVAISFTAEQRNIDGAQR
jgi:hypothetical protein